MLIVISIFIALIPIVLVCLYYLNHKRSQKGLKGASKGSYWYHTDLDYKFKSYYEAKRYVLDQGLDIKEIKQWGFENE